MEFIAFKRESWSVMRSAPPDIWREILSYLPLRSLLRFRSVSRKWKFIIDEPYFAILHAQHGSVGSSLIVRETESSGKSRWFLRCSQTFSRISKIRFPLRNLKNSNWEVVGARDGLLLLRRITKIHVIEVNYVLWNPSIGKIMRLPPPPPLQLLSSNFHFQHCSLGFDPSKNDYKVVLFIPRADHKPTPWPSFQVFSVKDRSWVEVASSAVEFPHQVVHLHSHEVSVGEYIHWLGRINHIPHHFDSSFHQCSYTLVSLNLTSMTVSYNPLPEKDVPLLKYPIFAGRSFLGLVTNSQIWALEGGGLDEDYKTGTSWSKKCAIDDVTRTTMAECLHVTRDGLHLLLKVSNAIYAYDLKRGQPQMLACTTKSLDFVNSHIESLVLLG